MTVSEPEVGEDHVTATELEVARLVPSWIPAGAILSRGIVSLMVKTCVGVGIYLMWCGSVICPQVRVT